MLFRSLKRQNVPALTAWAYSPDYEHPAIGFDNRAAMKLLTQEVLARGHREVGVISAITKGNDRARERVHGIKEAVAEAGIDPLSLEVIETSYEIENGGGVERELIE